MPEVTLSEPTHASVPAFRPIIEAVLERELSPDECLDLIVTRGVDALLNDLLGPQGPKALLQSLQQLGTRYPVQVYGFVAETVRSGAAAEAAGAAAEEWERARRRVGLRRPQAPE
jgi:hypothetical protein